MSTDPSYTYPNSTTVALNTETTYDWNAEEATVPVNLTVTKVIRLNGQAISVGGGARYWVDDTDGSPKGWGHVWSHPLFSRNNQLSLY
jgi:hypothetical protein